MVAALLPIVAGMGEDGKIVTGESNAEGPVQPRMAGAGTTDAISPGHLSA
jgi:hypothetical protein